MENENKSLNRLFEAYHKIKLKLDAICQDAGDKDVESFMSFYQTIKEVKSKREQ